MCDCLCHGVHDLSAGSQNGHVSCFLVDCVLFILQHLQWNKVSNYQNNESNSCWAKNDCKFTTHGVFIVQNRLVHKHHWKMFAPLLFLMNVPQWLHSGFALFSMYPYNKSEWWSVCLFCLRWSCPCQTHYTVPPSTTYFSSMSESKTKIIFFFN